MRWRGLVCAIFSVIGVVSIGATAQAQGESMWIEKPLQRLSEMPAQPPQEGEASCSGTMSLIEIKDVSSLRPACVYGIPGNSRMARYENIDGRFVYGFAFASDARFHEISDMCGGVAGCVYSPSENTALVLMESSPGVLEIKVIKEFSKRLTRQSAPAGSLRLSEGSEPFLSNTQGPLKARSVAVSTNGRWAVVELYLKGLVRVDMRTGEYKWFATLGNQMGTTPEAVLGLAISNDGNYAVVTGWYNGVDIYEITDTCGYQGETAPPAVSWCLAGDIDYYYLFPGYKRAQNPHFSSSGTRIRFLIETWSGYKYITITPRDQVLNTSLHYVAFGDSFTSGEGELSDDYYLSYTNTADNHCHVSTRSYPYLLMVYSERMVENRACSGSRIHDVREASTELLKDEEGAQTVAVSLGVGGNDVDFMGKLKSCLGPGTCEWAKQGTRAATANEMKRLLPDLIELIRQLQQDSGSPMFLVGYPLVINTSQDAQCSPLIASLLSREEREYMDQSIRYLNDILETAAQFTNIAYVNVEDSLIGERLCDASEKAMNGVRVGDDIAPLSSLPDVKVIGAESFHPTPLGHSRLASAIDSQLGYEWHALQCEECQANTTPPPYWSLGASALQLSAYQLAQNFLLTDALLQGGATTFAFSADTFEPNSTVTIELHSNTAELGAFKAASDGSLQGTLALPRTETGYHTIHAKGASRSGEAIDIYQTVFIAPDTNIEKEQGAFIALEFGDTGGGKGVSSGKSSKIRDFSTIVPETAVLGLSSVQSLGLRPVDDGTSKATNAEAIAVPSRNSSPFFIVYCLAALSIIAIVVTALFRRKV